MARAREKGKIVPLTSAAAVGTGSAFHDVIMASNDDYMKRE